MTTREQREREFLLLREMRIRAARRDFWEYCKLRAPDFYKDTRWHLRLIAWVLQALYERRLTKSAFRAFCEEHTPQWFINEYDWNQLRDEVVYANLAESIPPRMGKSRTLVLFTEWVFGQDITNRVITASYNEDMATDFSRYTRDGISEEKLYPHEIVYNDIFPDVRVAEGNASYRQWALEGQFFSYKGAGLGGSITGKGANCFPAGTMVQTEFGPMDIEELCGIPDPPKVLSYDVESKQTVYRNIVASREIEADTLTKITTKSGREIVSTCDHRIYDARCGFKPAREFAAGYWLMDESVQFDVVESVECLKTDRVPVYDIQVYGTENFFANGILVHNCLIIDDPVKNAEEAFNENMLDKQWQWYTGTFLSRQEQRLSPIKIVNMTRWSKKDIVGRILSGRGAWRWFVLKIAIESKDGQHMLCDEILPREAFEELKEETDPLILQANYYQEPIDVQGLLYKEFKTYDRLPVDENGNSLFEKIIAYGDTADSGSDYLCVPIAGVYMGELYMIDVVYTQDGMEITEPLTSDALVHNNVTVAKIESNSGGKNFARAVDRLMWERHQTKKVHVEWFHQSKNKEARILSNSVYVMQHIFMPSDWRYRWPEYHKAMTEYQRAGNNKHDDAPDATTGLVEMMDYQPQIVDEPLAITYEDMMDSGSMFDMLG